MNRHLQAVLDDPALFVVTYFPHRIQRLERFHTRLIHTSTSDVRSLTLYPAGHGKTTLVSTLLPIWAVCKDPNIRIAIIAKNTTEGEGIMRAIQSELVDNDDLVADFGPFRPTEDGKAWSLSRMDVAARTRRGKESTLAMFGAASKDVLGYRTDWSICDDVVTQDNSHTPETRGKMRNWFDLCVETGPEHIDSRLTVVGTRFHPGDLYGDLQELAVPNEEETKLLPLYATYREDAVVDEDKHTTLWPERWPWTRLMQQKVKVGTLSFNKRYRNMPVDESRMVFREEHVRGGFVGRDLFPGCLDKNYRAGDSSDHWRIVAGFDPAIGTSHVAKFCAHIVVAQGSCRDHERCYWIVDLERDQWSMPQQVDLIIRKHLEYGLAATMVEKNGYQVGLLEAIEQKMAERDVALKVDPHFSSRQNKPDPETGVQAMAPWFERGRVHIPWGDAHSQRKMRQLVDELIMYPDARTTDTVMALWFAWRNLETASPRFAAMNRLPAEAPYWSRRTRRRVVRNPAFAQRVPAGEQTT